MDNSAGHLYGQHTRAEAFGKRSGSRYDYRRTRPKSWSARRVCGAENYSFSASDIFSSVLNVVHGTVDTVNRICDHPAIRAISFVGGDRAGKHIYERWVILPVIPNMSDPHTTY